MIDPSALEKQPWFRGYEITKPLLSSTWGRFLARDPHGESCLLTVAASHLSHQEFVGEAERRAQFHNSTVAPVLSSAHESAPGLSFICQAAPSGTSLRTLLAERGPMVPAAGAALVCSLADALAVLHREGIAHGGLGSDVVFLDAGVAGGLSLQLLGVGDCLLELPPHAVSRFAPERQTGRMPEVHSDVWALAALLQETLEGTGPEERSRSSSKKLGPVVADAIERSLAADPEKRPNSMRALVQDLRPLAASLQQLSIADCWRRQPTLGTASGVHVVDLEDSEHEDSEDAALVGSTLADEYTLLRVLGVGGMGAVYEARDSQERLVAVKLVRVRESNAKASRRFLREAKAASQLSSPHVTRVIAFGVDRKSQRPYMVMELLNGQDLAQILAQVGPLRPEVAIRVMLDVCAGVREAHDAGLVHRDIKPSNVLLHQEGETTVAKVCDFGVVKNTSLSNPETVLTRTGAIIGSPAYMSPQQAADSSRVDPRDDIWSIAITLYEALSGRPAWAHCNNVGEVLAKLQTQAVPPLQDVAPWIEPALAEVIQKGVHRDLLWRFQTVAEFEAALAPYAKPGALTHSDLTAVDSALLSKRPTKPPALGTTSSLHRSLDGREHKPQRRRLVLGGALLFSLAAVVAVVFRIRTASQPMPVTSVAAPVASCTIAECAKTLGGPARCLADGSCVALQAEGCQVLADETTATNEQTLWFGAMFPVRDSDPFMAELGKASTQALDLARRDFMAVSGGLPSRRPDGAVRPIGVIACDDSADPLRVARHLVHVGVPAIVGFRSSKDVLDLARGDFIPNDVLTIAALNTSDLITQIPHPADRPRLVFRTATRTGEAAQVLATLVETLERDKQGSVRRPFRVMLLRSHDAVGLALSERMFAALQVNRRSASEQEGTFRELSYDAATTRAEMEATMVLELLEQQPNVVIFHMLSDLLLEGVLDPLEKKWPKAQPRAIYLFPGSLEGEALRTLLARRPDLALRLYGMTPQSNTETNLRFTRSYNAAFNQRLVSAESPGAPYDSFYLLAYAAFASGVDRPRGADLVRGIAQLIPPGKTIEVGPTSILDALGELGNKRSIDLVGAYGRLDFDIKSGESPADYAILCPFLGKDGALASVESKLSYDSRTRGLQGVLECPKNDRR